LEDKANIEDLKTKIELIFGGSFDPVHQGHLNVINSLRKHFPDWSIRLLPCSVPALKEPTSASFKQRVAMLELATKAIKGIVIDQRENDRFGKSYTLDSLKSLAKENPNVKRALVVGADTLKSMHKWFHWQEVREYCHLIFVNRPGYDINDLAKEMKLLGFVLVKNKHELESSQGSKYYCLIIEEKDISSSEVRSHLLNNLSVDRFIPNNVNEYIVKNKIYQ